MDPMSFDSHAAPTRISSVSPSHISKKLRVFGRVFHYNHNASLLILQDPMSALPVGLFVDVSLCLDPFKSLSWTRENMNLLMVIGYLELSPTLLSITNVDQGLRPWPKVDTTFILRALILEECPGLNINLWDDVFKKFEERGDYPSVSLPS